MEIIKIENLNHIYSKGTPLEKKALDSINIKINKGEFIGLIGHTGSGKSTLVQHLNGLLKASEGRVIVDGRELFKDKLDMSKIREKVGLVFQYPEYQLFEETIFKDISYGPKNMGLSQEEIERRVNFSMEAVGLSLDLKDKSPFDLSGGQKRRVAIAGILAMKPEVLVLDEPTAGLDPKGRDEILDEIYKLYKSTEITIVIVSHSMDDIAKFATRIIVMNKGKVFLDGKPEEIFMHYDELKKVGLGVPESTKIMRKLKEKGMDVKLNCITVDEAYKEIERIIGGKNA